MSAIRGKNTKPEHQIRRALHARGFRFRLHSAGLPGRPDLVLRKYRAVIFVHGCFWHGHNCPLFRLPATRTAFWEAKITGNRARDTRQEAELLADGWRVAKIWECALKGPERIGADAVAGALAAWLPEDGARLEMRGRAQ